MMATKPKKTTETNSKPVPKTLTDLQKENPEELLKVIKTLTNATVISRAKLQSILGRQYDGDRDMYKVLGYRKSLRFEHYLAKYLRQDIARRIVDAPAKATWRGKFEVKEEGKGVEETKFEKSWKDLERQKRVSHFLERVDRVSGIGSFGILLIGVKDGKPLNSPVTPGPLSSVDDVLYFRAFAEGSVKIEKLEDDPKNPRFGLPLMYEIDFSNDLISESALSGETRGAATSGKSNNIQTVHWSRVIHVAEDKIENEIYGSPRLENVYNRLDDIEKVVGGTGEMYWSGARMGLQANIRNDWQLGDLTGDINDAFTLLETELDEYFNGIRRFIRTQGVDIQSLGSEVPDPSKTTETLLSVIAGARGIPKRILIGSERGELASTQDETNWNARVQERRSEFAEPEVIRPLIDRFIEWGIMPKPSSENWEVKWPTLFEMDDKEKAAIARLISEALKNYTDFPEDLIPPTQFIELLGFHPEINVDDITDELGRLRDKIDARTTEAAEGVESTDELEKSEEGEEEEENNE